MKTGLRALRRKVYRKGGLPVGSERTFPTLLIGVKVPLIAIIVNLKFLNTIFR